MKLAQFSLNLLFFFLFVFASVGVRAQSSEAVRNSEKRIKAEVFDLYKELSKAKSLLSLQNLYTLPSNTTISYIGTYPNRTGFKLTRFKVVADPLQKATVASSEEKSLTLIFNGSVLSRVECSVRTEDTKSELFTKTKVIDTTPLDEDLDDMEIIHEGLEGNSKYFLAGLANDGFDHSKNKFLKDFYIRFLQDFDSTLRVIGESQNRNSNTQKTKMIQRMQNSLRY